MDTDSTIITKRKNNKLDSRRDALDLSFRITIMTEPPAQVGSMLKIDGLLPKLWLWCSHPGRSRGMNLRRKQRREHHYSPDGLTLREAQRQYKIPTRKLLFLIRHGAIDATLDGDKLLVTEEALRDYLHQPKEVIREQHTPYLKTLGPGLITGASDDDPSGIGTYSQVGSAYGLGLVWMALYLLPMMIAIQETVARIGIVTQQGLAQVIGRRFGKVVLYPTVILLVIANTVNIGADIGAMVACLQLLFPLNFYIGIVGLTLFMTILEIFVPYHRYAPILKWLAFSLAAYIIAGFIIKPDWSVVLTNLVIPKIQFDTSFLAAMVAVMGTTITPYLFFWQASEEVEEKRDRGTIGDFHTVVINREIKEMHKDTYTGMLASEIVTLFIIMTTAFVLHDNGITDVDSAQKAAMALRPLAGDLAALLFTIGIFGVGLLSVPVLAGSSAYAVAELFRMNEGLDKRLRSAKGFYLIIAASMMIGLLLNLIGINPIKALYYAAILNGMIAPLLMVLILLIGRDKRVLGPFTNSRWTNAWGWVATALMGGGAIALIVFMIFGF